MRSVLFVLLMLCGAALACGGRDPSRPDDVVSVVILGGETRSVEALGPLQLSALALNAFDVEVQPGTFRWHWRSTDPSVATVNDDGLVTVHRNGTVKISATALQASDTVTLNVEQQATRVTISQDTLVALTANATPASGTPIASTAMRVIARTADANGNLIAAPGAITWTTATPEYFTFTTNARGDTLLIVGTDAGASAPGPGTLSASFGAFPPTLVLVQVADQYAAMRILSTTAGPLPSPLMLEIPSGAAVVFVAVQDAQVVNGTGWRTGLIPGGGQEAQRFVTPGTYSFRLGAANPSVIVSP